MSRRARDSSPISSSTRDVVPIIAGQQIVEIVRDAAGEPPDRLHLLRLAVLHFELSHLREIGRDRQYPRNPPRGIMERSNGETDGYRRPVFPASGQLHPPHRLAPQRAGAPAAQGL